MKTFLHLTLCPHCDSVYQTLPAKAGETALCSRCYAVLWRGHGRVSTFLLPLTLTAGITLAMACFLPVMSVGFHGIANEITLWDAAWAPASTERNAVMAICTACLLVAAPFMQIALTGWLLLFAHFARPAPAFIFSMRALKWLHPWSMVEVGVLGFLVAGIKLSAMLDVDVGPGGWALAVSCMLIIWVNNHDLHPLWDLLTMDEIGESE
ncbi:paraquat-inducible protein A [Phytobacter sp. V91]|uniref:paraquat-inducible protein A n=1 Tax=Phytobacter sp. V91 TaxID=3369425 RepID=UPI003F5E50A4